MTDSLFQQLKRIGIDDELAHQVSASLDPDHNASKKDVLLLQKAILKAQSNTEQKHYELAKAITELRMDMHKEVSNARIEFHSMHRHSICAFGAILVSIFTVLAVNIYFHF